MKLLIYALVVESCGFNKECLVRVWLLLSALSRLVNPSRRNSPEPAEERAENGGFIA
jgi:hypothetical protein